MCQDFSVSRRYRVEYSQYQSKGKLYQGNWEVLRMVSYRCCEYYNDTARYVDQGGGKRKGRFAVYLEPWHADVFEFLDLKKNHGKEELRARDLFYAMWISDLFMERVKNNGEWSCSVRMNVLDYMTLPMAANLKPCITNMSKKERPVKTVKAQDLWFAILESQIETGTPYILYKDAANKKSNQKKFGTIRSSNLCTEIMEYTSPDEVAVCNLASISLWQSLSKRMVLTTSIALYEISRVVTRNLNKVIDINYYPIPEAREFEYATSSNRDWCTRFGGCLHPNASSL